MNCYLEKKSLVRQWKKLAYTESYSSSCFLKVKVLVMICQLNLETETWSPIAKGNCGNKIASFWYWTEIAQITLNSHQKRFPFHRRNLICWKIWTIFINNKFELLLTSCYFMIMILGSYRSVRVRGHLVHEQSGRKLLSSTKILGVSQKTRKF